MDKLRPEGYMRPIRGFNPALPTPILNLVDVLFSLQISRFPTRWHTPDTLTLVLYPLTPQAICKDEPTYEKGRG